MVEKCNYIFEFCHRGRLRNAEKRSNAARNMKDIQSLNFVV